MGFISILLTANELIAGLKLNNSNKTKTTSEKPKTMQNLSKIITLWREVNDMTANIDIEKNRINEVVASMFIPGKYYYFILDFYDLGFEYLHPSVEEIVGCKKEDFSFNLIFEKMHPEDAAMIPQKEAAATEFFYQRLPVEKIPYYKSSYTFRLNDGKGGWKNILHQSVALQVAENGRIHHVLCVHSDITFLQALPDNHISFIGLNGEPSYFGLSTDPKTLLEPTVDFFLSKREIEIVRLLVQGLSSKEIASKLFISNNTVNVHRQNLLKKTGTKNTLELAVLCIRKGLL